MSRNNGGETIRKTPWRYMLSGMTRNKAVATVGLTLTMVSTLLTVFPAVFIGLAAREIQNTAAMTAQFVNYVWLIIIFGLLYMGLFFVGGWVWATLTLRWERDARQDFFEALQVNSMTFHDEFDSKRLLAVAMQDIQWVRFSLNPALRNIATGLASFFITALLLIQMDWLPGLSTMLTIQIGSYAIPIYGFTIIMLLGFPIYLIFSYRYANAIEPVRRNRSENMEALTSITQGVFQGIEVVRAFDAEEFEIKKFHDISKSQESLTAKEGKLSAFYLPALILAGMTTVAFAYAGYAVINGIMDVSQLIIILGLLTALQGLNFQFPMMLLILRGGFVNAQRIVDFLNWEDPMTEPEEEVLDVDWTGDVVFDNVSFRYGREENNNPHYAIRNLSITIPGGSRVALIGGPGAGKSSLLKLLLRLYDPTEGEIRVGGVNLRNVSTKSVRDVVGLVEQDIFLFRMTIRENIAFGRSGASDEEIISAAKRAQADEFIVEMPEGYDSMIGERGMTLSGGQRQRLAIARAMVQNPKILLLDDSVSAVDAQTEYLMRKALDEVMKDRTSITVTQRLRTLMESDMVIILDKGHLVASGRHEDLLRESEHYRRVFERLPGAQELLATISKRGGVA
ncbi:MAG: ABC transporter ATP-binding protein/permease [Candidatus Thorarchaeota archaeon]|nr:ABC transporter ATP-binding protein/permease [Candidatus Thorarchaeota archaeon]